MRTGSGTDRNVDYIAEHNRNFQISVALRFLKLSSALYSSLDNMHCKSRLGKNLIIDNVLNAPIEQASTIRVPTSTAISKL